MLPPAFDHNLCFLQCVEDFSVEQFVSQLAVEAFAISVFPRAPGFDVGGPGPNGRDPMSKGNRDELRAIFRANVGWNAPRDEEIAERLDHIGSLELACDMDCQALASELVDDAQYPVRASIVSPIGDEVIGPHMVGALRA